MKTDPDPASAEGASRGPRMPHASVWHRWPWGMGGTDTDGMWRLVQQNRQD